MAGTLTHLLTKSKLKGALDGIFVSSRAAQILGEVKQLILLCILCTAYGVHCAAIVALGNTRCGVFCGLL